LRNGTAGGLSYQYGPDGKPVLVKEPKLVLNDDNAGKPEGIHLMIGRRPYFSIGNSTGDRQMLEYTKAGDRARLSMIVPQRGAHGLRLLRRLRARRLQRDPGPGRAESRAEGPLPGAFRPSSDRT